MENETNNKEHVNISIKRPSIAKEILTYAAKEAETQAINLFANLFKGTLNMANDIAVKSVDKWLYPNGGAPKVTSSNKGTYSEVVNYTTYSKSNKSTSNHSKSSQEVDFIYVDTEQDAKDIVNGMIEEITNYDKIKVSTVYEWIHRQTSFTDFKFGWTKDHLDYIGYRRDGQRWFIDLPKPVNVENI